MKTDNTKEEEKKRYYLEIDGKIEEEILKEDMAQKVEILGNMFSQLGFKHTRFILKENPIYDSFGNLWE